MISLDSFLSDDYTQMITTEYLEYSAGQPALCISANSSPCESQVSSSVCIRGRPTRTSSD